MKKILIFLGVLLISSPANAEWTYITTSTEKDAMYLDFYGMRTNGNFRYIWRLLDRLKPNEDAFSTTVYYEIDCRTYGVKMLAFNDFNRPMGNGNPNYTSTTPSLNFHYPSRGDLHYTVVKRTCEY